MLSIQSIVLMIFISSALIDGQKFTNCGSASDHIQLKGLKITPHPIKVPGPVVVELTVDLSEDVVHPLQSTFLFKATAFGFTQTIKCENGVGSCTYGDFSEICKTCPYPVLEGKGQVMRIPMNLTATIPIGSKATGQVTINFLSASKKSACVSITNIELRK